MQDRLRVAVRLSRPKQHEVSSGREREARNIRSNQQLIPLIASVLRVDYRSKAGETVEHLSLGNQSVSEPVGEQLARDPQRRAVFHQADIMDVWNGGAPDTLVDPAHDVAEDRLHVVVEFLTLLVCTPLGVSGQRHDQNGVDGCRGAGCNLLLHLEHVCLVIVQRVQGGCRRRRNPGRRRTGARLRTLLLKHRGHQCRHRPHALTDLRTVREPCGKPGVDIEILVRADERLRLEVTFANKRSGQKRGMDLIAGAVEKASVDEDDTLFGHLDAGLKVHRGSALLVHDSELDSERRQAEKLLDATEQLDRERDLFGSVHLRLDHIHRPRKRIAKTVGVGGVIRSQVVQGTESGDERIQNALGNLVAIAIEYRIGGHQVTDLADEHERPTAQCHRFAGGGGEDALGLHHPGECLACLAHLLGQRAEIQLQPVAVAECFVIGIDGRDGIFQIHDGCDR